MTKTVLHKLSPLLPLLLAAGCAATTNPTAGKPGEGKGYWVTEGTPRTGSMQPHRYWVSTESGATTATGTGVNSYGGNVPTGIGSTTGALSGGGGAGGGGFGGAGGGGR